MNDWKKRELERINHIKQLTEVATKKPRIHEAAISAKIGRDADIDYDDIDYIEGIRCDFKSMGPCRKL